jgi:hypothetical protein
MCEYDLRAQEESRCPECGYRFDWAELRDPSRRVHPYLFEHHPERNVWSFVRTLLGGWTPRKFWSTLHPTQPSRPRRMLVYVLIVLLAGVIPVAGNVLVATMQIQQAMIANRGRIQRSLQTRRATLPARYQNMTVQQIVDQVAPVPTISYSLRAGWGNSNWRLRTFVPLALWPVLTLAAMMVFQISMSRARVRVMHVVRCVAYSADVLLWMSIALGAAAVLSFVSGTTQNFDTMLVWIALLAWAVFVYRFTIALRLYTRFEHPRSTVVATQLITVLTMAVIMVYVFNPRW